MTVAIIVISVICFALILFVSYLLFELSDIKSDVDANFKLQNLNKEYLEKRLDIEYEFSYKCVESLARAIDKINGAYDDSMTDSNIENKNQDK